MILVVAFALSTVHYKIKRDNAEEVCAEVVALMDAPGVFLEYPHEASASEQLRAILRKQKPGNNSLQRPLNKPLTLRFVDIMKKEEVVRKESEDN